jgi:hypothetical protein
MAWHAKHYHNAKEAEAHFKALKSVGCQVDKQDHDGHIDVRYRLPFWKTLAFKTDAEAHQWQKYLDKMGFETRHESLTPRFEVAMSALSKPDAPA